jgi:predicted LPLAT superfamily acyltransferase
LWSIYGVPTLLAVPVGLLLWQLNSILGADNWWMVLGATVFASLAYLVPAFFLCIEKEHQRAAIYWVRQARSHERW